MRDIRGTIRPFCKKAKDKTHRYSSWNYCYRYFGRRANFNTDQGALILFAYLSSWGMLRNSFLMSFSYKLQIPIVRILRRQRYFSLRRFNILDANDHQINDFINTVMDLKEEIKDCYDSKIAPYKIPNKNVTDTLITKIMLGTLGCAPAFDDLFKLGLVVYQNDNRRGHKRRFLLYNNKPTRKPSFNIPNFRKLITHIRINHNYINQAQNFAHIHFNQKYPVMKIVDMYFWQKGQKKKSKKK